VDLPMLPPVAPMLAKSVRSLPTVAGHHDGPPYYYEPKWDGFRCIVFRDGDEVELGSRNERPLTRYFPEVVAAVRAQLPSRCVLDGEIVIARDGRLDFDALLSRIHPAASRINLLAEQTPASFVAFDALALGDDGLFDVPFAHRRELLERALAGAGPPVHLTAVTSDPRVAERWFHTFEGAGLDGVVAKAADLPYRPDQRLMLKVKHERTADCVLAGFRWHKTSTPEAPLLGSLLLGLYDDAGDLQHVGVAASFTVARRADLVVELAPLREGAMEGHPWAGWASTERGGGEPERMPGAQSRWNAGKDLSWEPLCPTRVVEVRYDHMEGRRFRHTARFARWRPDREPRSCTYAQLEEPVRYDLAEVLR